MRTTKRQEEIGAFIALVCGVAPCMMRQVFTRGGCYRFHQILKSRFPEAEAFEIQGHCVSRIAGRYWDITGPLPDSDRYRQMSARDHAAYAACYFDEVHFMCKLAQLKVAQWDTDLTVTT